MIYASQPINTRSVYQGLVLIQWAYLYYRITNNSQWSPVEIAPDNNDNR